MAIICLASMNAATSMNRIGRITNPTIRIRKMWVITSPALTFPTYWLFIAHLHQYSTSSPPFWAANWRYVNASMMKNRTIDMALALPRYPFSIPV